MLPQNNTPIIRQLKKQLKKEQKRNKIRENKLQEENKMLRTKVSELETKLILYGYKIHSCTNDNSLSNLSFISLDSINEDALSSSSSSQIVQQKLLFNENSEYCQDFYHSHDLKQLPKEGNGNLRNSIGYNRVEAKHKSRLNTKNNNNNNNRNDNNNNNNKK